MCALLPQCGGLTQEDFEQVNVDGFEAEDQLIDHNDYAYSMEYFKADGADDGEGVADGAGAAPSATDEGEPNRVVFGGKHTM